MAEMMAAVLDRIDGLVRLQGHIAPYDADLAPDSPLFEGGFLDSLGVMSLIDLIEEGFSIVFSDDDLLSEEFTTIAGISGLVVAALQAESGGDGTAPEGAPCHRAVDRLAGSLVDEGLACGVQLHVLQGGRPVLDLAVGRSPAGDPLTGDSVLPWFCLTKPVTALGLLALLRDRGRTAETPIAELVPFADPAPSPSVAQMLSHTAGIADDFPLVWEQMWLPEGTQLGLALPAVAAAAAGDVGGFRYSSWVSWVVLFEAMRRMVGPDLVGHLHEAVLTPLGMHGSMLALDPGRRTALGPLLAGQAFVRPGRVVPLPRFDADGPAARLTPVSGRGPARDVARFYDALLRHRLPGRLDGLEDTMRAPATAPFHADRFVSEGSGTLRWGLGLGLGPQLFGPVCSPGTFGHTGLESTFAFADPAYDLVVAGTFVGMIGRRAAQRRQNALVEALYRDLALDATGDPTDVSHIAAGVSAEPPLPLGTVEDVRQQIDVHLARWRDGRPERRSLPGRTRLVLICADGTVDVAVVTTTSGVDLDPAADVGPGCDVTVTASGGAWLAMAGGTLDLGRALRRGAVELTGPGVDHVLHDSAAPAFLIHL